MSATHEIDAIFGSGLSAYKLKKYGVGEPGLERFEDGRTESVVVAYDSQTADENWEEFLTRLDQLKENWSVDESE